MESCACGAESWKVRKLESWHARPSSSSNFQPARWQVRPQSSSNFQLAHPASSSKLDIGFQHSGVSLSYPNTHGNQRILFFGEVQF